MKIIIVSTIIFFVFFAFTFLRYRLVYSKIIRVESEVKYNMTDMEKNDFFRYSFESLIGKKRVFLKKKLSNAEWIYMSKKDYIKLHPASPLQLKAQNSSIRFKFETQYLVFGGYSAAKLISYEENTEKE